MHTFRICSIRRGSLLVAAYNSIVELKSPNVIARASYTALLCMAITKKKRSFDAAFKLRVVEYAEQDTNRGAGRKFQEL